MAHYGLIEGGGTKFVLGVADEAGAICARTRIPTGAPGETLEQAVRWFGDQNLEPAAIGIACFGPLELDPERPQWGHMLQTAKPHWSGADVLPADQPLNLEWILGRVLAPLAWVMGVLWRDAAEVGSLIGVKTVLNEFVAYLQLSSLLTGGADLSPRSVIIATYALCGFANFSSIAIQIGGIGGIAPTRRSDLARIGLRAMIAGTLAAFMTATIAGMII